MNILVVGSGGREHALVWKLSQSPQADRLYCAPGNAGCRQHAISVPIAVDDICGLRDFALEQQIHLTVVGPELPLALGITDVFAAHDLCVFGPTRAAAQLEASKAFAKTFMRQHGIATAHAEVFNDSDAAERYIRQCQDPLVVKADGLAAGKGVIVCQTQKQALEAVQQIMRGRIFGEAGDCVVIEDFLYGEEASFHVLVDGEHVIPLASSQDHKRVFDHDQGLNTGGMGAYSPAPVITDDLHQQILDDIVMPTVRGMAADGRPYRGVLYTGLMIVDGRPFVLEYNARFGDPETQPLLVRLIDDLLPLLDGAARGCLSGLQARFAPEPALCVVMASGGYPEAYETGFPITGLERVAEADGIWVFHAGTDLQNEQVVTNGGRVLGVTGRAASFASAIEQTYHVVQQIAWPGVHYRKDIGHRALQRTAS